MTEQEKVISEIRHLSVAIGATIETRRTRADEIRWSAKLSDLAARLEAIAPNVESGDAELPGMWSSADFTGGDPDERSYTERALAPPVDLAPVAAAIEAMDAARSALSQEGVTYADACMVDRQAGEMLQMCEAYCRALIATPAKVEEDGHLPMALLIAAKKSAPPTLSTGDTLVDEGLSYFDLSGDAGDKVYVAAIRAALRRTTQPAVAMQNLLAHIADNLNDMPISEDWAAKTVARIMGVLGDAQPAVVTDAMVELAIACYLKMEPRFEETIGVNQDTRDFVRELLTAALAPGGGS